MSVNFKMTFKESEQNFSVSFNSQSEKIQTEFGEICAIPPCLEDKTVYPRTARQLINADAGYDGLDDVTIEAIPYHEISNETGKTVIIGGQ